MKEQSSDSFPGFILPTFGEFIAKSECGDAWVAGLAYLASIKISKSQRSGNACTSLSGQSMNVRCV